VVVTKRLREAHIVPLFRGAIYVVSNGPPSITDQIRTVDIGGRNLQSKIEVLRENPGLVLLFLLQITRGFAWEPTLTFSMELSIQCYQFCCLFQYAFYVFRIYGKVSYLSHILL
jgi:hypothetical protein